jgi:hypothetical protein
MKVNAPKRALAVSERARRYLERCPPAISGQQGHNTTFRIVCALVHGFALSEAEALAALHLWNVQCQPPWSECELRHKVISATNASHSRPRGYLAGGTAERCACRGRIGAVQPPPTPPSSKPKFQPETLQRVAALVAGVDEQYVKDRSPLCPETQTPASFLQKLYRVGENILVFDVFKSQGQFVCQCTEPPYDAGSLDHLIHGHKDGVWFLCNAVDGEYHPNPREGGKLSRRSEESVTSWRYLMVESDKADPLQWLAALVQMPLRIAAIYTSAGRSIHALVRLDAVSKADLDAKARRVRPALEILGADQKSCRAVQLTRLPGCYRGEQGPPPPPARPRRRWVDEPLEFDEHGDPIWMPRIEPESYPTNLWKGGRLQELLYLDPEPDGQPIQEKPTRQDIHQEWLARVRSTKAA